MHICAHSAITMRADDLGFIYPEVNTERCVDCGLCERVCPFNNVGRDSDKQPLAYAVRHKNPEVVCKSRSGGFFTALTDSILQSGGIVYGAVLNDRIEVVHARADSYAVRDKMRGSKYSQSKMGDICNAVKQDLKGGKKVLFSGTPCQVVAITDFVGKQLWKNLITADIICHGVGSPQIWKKLVDHIEKTERRKIVDADFRDKKKYGWSGLHKESFLLENSLERKYYPYIYYNDLHVRESCSHCPYTCVPRHSDITLGDLWGYEKVVPEWNKDNNGISLVLVNSDKGIELMKYCLDCVESKPIELSKVMQPHLEHPIQFNKDSREIYSEAVRILPFEMVLEKYHKVNRPPLCNILRNKIKMLISR